MLPGKNKVLRDSNDAPRKGNQLSIDLDVHVSASSSVLLADQLMLKHLIGIILHLQEPFTCVTRPGRAESYTNWAVNFVLSVGSSRFCFTNARQSGLTKAESPSPAN